MKIRTDIQSSGIEEKAQKQTSAYMVKQFLARVPRSFNGEKGIFSKWC
jgi:hypothetical protein